MVLDGCKKIAHLLLFVHNVVREEQAAETQPWKREIEETFVVALPGIQKHEIEIARYFRNFLEGIPGYDRDDVSEPGASDVLFGRSSPTGIDLNGRQMTAGLA